MLIVGGVVVVGEQTIAYYSMTLDTFRYIIPQTTIFECYTVVQSDKEEWILEDAEGRIYSLSIENDKFIFSKLGEVAVFVILLTIVLHTLRFSLLGCLNTIHRFPFLRFSNRVPQPHTPSKT